VSTSSERRGLTARRRTTHGWLGGAALLLGFGLLGFGLVANWADRTLPVPVAATSPVASLTPAYGPEVPEETPSAEGAVPRRLQVPALGIDAPILAIRATDGVLFPPGNPQQLGWWRDGAKVGAASGSVLVTGHTVHTGGGAMDHLADLAVGDRIVVRSQRGDVTFEVARVTYYPRQSLADHAQQTFDQSGPNRLVLITCERWNGTSYDGNTVVVARPVDR